METIIQSEWLTVTEAANHLRVKPRTLLLWARQGKVKAFALSGTKRRVWRFRQADLDGALPKGWSNEKGSTAQNG
jgi:excisionase family DNA binding protein